MSRKLIFFGVLSLVFAPGAAWSLGLGEIRLNSYLNQPINAEITLAIGSPAELETLRVELASPETFGRYGLDRPAYFDDLRFRIRRTGAAAAVVEVSSTRPVVEPFMTFLVEARWSGGRALREYTLLLDPPIFLPTPAPEAVPAPAPAPVVEAPRPAPEPSVRPAPAPPPVAAPVPARPDFGAEYRVQRNDTLWGIANRIRPDDTVSTNQVMVALFSANPDAFDGNINRLRAGAVLRVPSREQIAATSAREATAEVRRQTDEWRAPVAAAPVERRLELAPPTETPRPPAPAPEPVAAPPVRSDEVLDAVQELRGELAETRRLMEVKDAEIAALQARLAELEAAPPAEEAAVAPAAPVEPAPQPEAAAPAPAPSLMDRLLGGAWIWLALVLALVAAVAAIVVRKRKEEARSIEEELAETGTWGTLQPAAASRPAAATAAVAGTGAAAGAAAPRRARAEEAGAIEVEESAADAEAPPVQAAAGEEPRYPFEDTIAGDAGINLEQSDPLAEADFHMAYGLYDQAAEIIQKAIDREPGRYDLRRKLLDICFVWGNAEAFLAQARAAREMGGEVVEADWSKVAIMGRQICPGEPLFEGAAMPAPDVELGGETMLHPPAGSDTGASGSWLDFDVGEAGTTADALGDTREQPSPDFSKVPRIESTAEIDLEELGIDLDIGESGEYALKDLAERGPDFGEEGLEVPAGAEDSLEAPAEDEAERDGGTLMMDASWIARRSTDPTQRGEGYEIEEDEPTLTGIGEFEEEAEDQTLAEPVPRVRPAGDQPTVVSEDSGLEEEPADQTLVKKFSFPSDEAVTTEAEAFEEDEALDLDDLTAMLEAEPGAARAGEQAETMSADVEYGDERIEEVGDTREMAPPELDEVGTKLDLARAYLDMGDPEGARSILEEVIEEGSEAQREEARQLLDGLD
jgi:pilus assembly protein FimV